MDLHSACTDYAVKGVTKCLSDSGLQLTNPRQSIKIDITKLLCQALPYKQIRLNVFTYSFTHVLMLFNSYIEVTLRYIFTAFNSTQVPPNHDCSNASIKSNELS